MMVTKVWDAARPDYVQGTAFLDGVNDHGVEVEKGQRPRGFAFCSSVTPSSIPCGGEMHKHKTNIGMVAVAEVETPPPADDNYGAWESPFNRWHWPAKTDPS